MRYLTKAPVLSFVATLVLGGVGAYLLIGSSSSTEVAIPEAQAAVAAPKAETGEQDAGDAIMREGLTKILQGMDYQGVSDAEKAPIEEKLEALGGPDPSVPPLDGPDGAQEWSYQAEIDAHLCDEGDQGACDELPSARRKAER